MAGRLWTRLFQHTYDDIYAWENYFVIRQFDAARGLACVVYMCAPFCKSKQLYVITLCFSILFVECLHVLCNILWCGCTFLAPISERLFLLGAGAALLANGIRKDSGWRFLHSFSCKEVSNARHIVLHLSLRFFFFQIINCGIYTQELHKLQSDCNQIIII